MTAVWVFAQHPMAGSGAAVCRQAAAVTSFAFFLKLLAYTLLSLTVGLPSVLSIRAGFVTQLLGGSFCAFCWSACEIAIHLRLLPPWFKCCHTLHIIAC